MGTVEIDDKLLATDCRGGCFGIVLQLADLVTQSERTAEEFASRSTEMMNLHAKVMFEQAQLLGTILKYRIAEGIHYTSSSAHHFA